MDVLYKLAKIDIFSVYLEINILKANKMKFSIHQTIIVFMLTLFFTGCEVGIDSLKYDSDSQVISVSDTNNEQNIVTNDTIVISNISRQIKNSEIRLELNGEEAKSFEGSFKREGQTLTITVNPRPDFNTNIDKNITLIATVFVRDKPSCEHMIIKVFDAKKSETKRDTTPPNITINGPSVMTIEASDRYRDQGATARDDVDGTIIVKTEGIVDIDIVGEYIITYTATDESNNTSTTIRTVIVKVPIVNDIIAPDITLKCESVVSLMVGEEYKEKNATALDNRDGNVRVVITGSVNTSMAGTYEIIYTATDSANNSATATRTVIVTSVLDIEPPKIIIRGEANITVLLYTKYLDDGASVDDNIDGTSLAIATANDVNTSKVGIYFVSYSTTDSAGNKAQSVTRKVTVIDPARNKLLGWCSGTNNVGLWRTNGTKEGTLEILDKDNEVVKNPNNFVKIGNTTYFSAEFANGKSRLWKSDGTSSGTLKIDSRDIKNPQELMEVNGILFFTATGQEDNKRQVYRLNSDTDVIETIPMINSGSAKYSDPHMLTKVGDTFYFVGTYSGGQEGNGNQKIWGYGKDNGGLPSFSHHGALKEGNITEMVGVNGVPYYVTNGILRKGDINPLDYNFNPITIDASINPRNLYSYNGTLIFEGHDAQNGDELWKSDGTSSGTKMVENFAGSGALSLLNANPKKFTTVGSVLYFSARTALDSDHYIRKVNDLDTMNTPIIENIKYNSVKDEAKYPKNLTAFENNTLLFNTNLDDGNGRKSIALWRVDNATDEARIYKSIDDISTLHSYGIFNGKFLFKTISVDEKSEKLWITDGDNTLESIATGCK